METNDKSKDEARLKKKLTSMLRSAGYLFPITDAQVEAFEKLGLTEELPASLADPGAILRRGVVKSIPLQQPKADERIVDSFQRLAARHGKELTPEILRKMQEDRSRDGNDK